MSFGLVDKLLNKIKITTDIALDQRLSRIVGRHTIDKKFTKYIRDLKDPLLYIREISVRDKSARILKSMIDPAGTNEPEKPLVLFFSKKGGDFLREGITKLNNNIGDASVKEKFLQELLLRARKAVNDAKDFRIMANAPVLCNTSIPAKISERIANLISLSSWSKRCTEVFDHVDVIDLFTGETLIHDPSHIRDTGSVIYLPESIIESSGTTVDRAFSFLFKLACEMVHRAWHVVQFSDMSWRPVIKEISDIENKDGFFNPFFDMAPTSMAKLFLEAEALLKVSQFALSIYKRGYGDEPLKEIIALNEKLKTSLKYKEMMGESVFKKFSALFDCSTRLAASASRILNRVVPDLRGLVWQ